MRSWVKREKKYPHKETQTLNKRTFYIKSDHNGRRESCLYKNSTQVVYRHVTVNVSEF